MENLRKVIFLFAFIFITGIIVTVITVNSSLNKSNHLNKIVEIQKDTTSLLKAAKKIV